MTCKKTQEFLARTGTKTKTVVNATKTFLALKEAKGLLKDVDEIVSSKGARVTKVSMKDKPNDALLASVPHWTHGPAPGPDRPGRQKAARRLQRGDVSREPRLSSLAPNPAVRLFGKGGFLNAHPGLPKQENSSGERGRPCPRQSRARVADRRSGSAGATGYPGPGPPGAAGCGA